MVLERSYIASFNPTWSNLALKVATLDYQCYKSIWYISDVSIQQQWNDEWGIKYRLSEGENIW